MKKEPNWSQVDHIIRLAVEEDVGQGDATTESLIPKHIRAEGALVAREAGICAGIEIVKRLYSFLDRRVRVNRLVEEGARFKPGTKLATVDGPARAILTGERTALNLLQRMCGVATLTHKYVGAIEGTSAKIYDTRKTIPGLRVLDKMAVFIGGGENHRHGLYDMILIKDNHLQLVWPECPKGSISCAINKAREYSDLPIMVEVDNFEQLKEALQAEPDMVLLDNMNPETLTQAVAQTRTICADLNLRRPLLEASGGVNMETVREIAKTGVDRISIGALTHSATALDIALDMGSSDDNEL